MSVILIMLPVALLLAAAGIGAFIWATRQGQFDDLDTPAIRAVYDDDEPSGAGASNAARGDSDRSQSPTG